MWEPYAFGLFEHDFGGLRNAEIDRHGEEARIHLNEASRVTNRGVVSDLNAGLYLRERVTSRGLLPVWGWCLIGRGTILWLRCLIRLDLDKPEISIFGWCHRTWGRHRFVSIGHIYFTSPQHVHVSRFRYTKRPRKKSPSPSPTPAVIDNRSAHRLQRLIVVCRAALSLSESAATAAAAAPMAAGRWERVIAMTLRANIDHATNSIHGAVGSPEVSFSTKVIESVAAAPLTKMTVRS